MIRIKFRGNLKSKVASALQRAHDEYVPRALDSIYIAVGNTVIAAKKGEMYDFPIGKFTGNAASSLFSLFVSKNTTRFDQMWDMVIHSKIPQGENVYLRTPIEGPPRDIKGRAPINGSVDDVLGWQTAVTFDKQFAVIRIGYPIEYLGMWAKNGPRAPEDYIRVLYQATIDELKRKNRQVKRNNLRNGTGSRSPWDNY